MPRLKHSRTLNEKCLLQKDEKQTVYLCKSITNHGYKQKTPLRSLPQSYLTYQDDMNVFDWDYHVATEKSYSKAFSTIWGGGGVEKTMRATKTA